MIRSARSRRSRVAIGAGAVVAALLVAGCGAGQVTGTSTQRSSAGGANAGAGDVLVRDAEIKFGGGVPGAVVYPAGATAPLQMRIVNQGAVADKLLSASSPAASSVQVSGHTDLPPGDVIVVNGGSAPLVGDWPVQMSLTGLQQEVRAGLTYDVVLVFERAGQIRLSLPVDNPTTPREKAAE